jgi:MFS family permease
VTVGSRLGGARFGPLRSQGFRALYTAHAVSVVGDGLVSVALAFAVLDLTGSASDLGLVLLARLVPMVFLYVAGGVWADRLPRHRLMVASHALAFVAQATSGALLIGGRASIASLAGLQALHGVATAFYRPASSGILPRLVRREELQQANALLWGALAVGGVLGPALAGIVVATAGPGWALLGDGCSFALSALLLLRLRRHDLGTAPAREPFWTDVRAGWDEVRSRTWIWLSIVYFSLFQLVYLPAIFVLGPTIAKRSLGGPAAWALVVAALGIGSILGNVVALRLRIQRPLAASYVVILAAVPTLVLLGAAAPVFAIAAAAVVSGAAVGIANTFWETTLQRGVPGERLSRVAAYDWMGSTALRPVGLALIGPLAVAVGTEPLLLGISGVVVAGTIAILGVDETRDRRTEDAPAELLAA